MKKLLIIIGDLSVGGGQNMVSELVGAIDKNSWKIDILCYAKKTNTEIERRAEEYANITYLNTNGKIGFTAICKVFKAVKQISPDVIHAHLGGMVFAIPWTALNKTPLVVTAHTKPSKAFNKKVEWLLKCLLRSKKRKTIVAAVSQENWVETKKYLGVGDDACRFVNNGISLSRYYRKSHEHFTFINVARQDENKNQAAIIEAFGKLYKENNNIRLILAGNGPTHNLLIELAKSKGLERVVMFPGMVPDAENYYSIADVYVQSSFREALPLSVLEAMAAGLPIISTDIGGLRDVVRENGILVDAGNNEALLEAMRSMICETNEKMKFMSDESFRLVEDYSSIKMAEGYMALYDELTR